jgi:hypothetical protein
VRYTTRRSPEASSSVTGICSPGTQRSIAIAVNVGRRVVLENTMAFPYMTLGILFKHLAFRIPAFRRRSFVRPRSNSCRTRYYFPQHPLVLVVVLRIWLSAAIILTPIHACLRPFRVMRSCLIIFSTTGRILIRRHRQPNTKVAVPDVDTMAVLIPTHRPRRFNKVGPS